jgi:hypothetical protein
MKRVGAFGEPRKAIFDVPRPHRDAPAEVAGMAVHERKFIDRKTSANLKFVSV